MDGLVKGKKGFITDPGNLIQGIIIGLIIGALVMYLMVKGIIPLKIC